MKFQRRPYECRPTRLQLVEGAEQRVVASVVKTRGAVEEVRPQLTFGWHSVQQRAHRDSSGQTLRCRGEPVVERDDSPNGEPVISVPDDAEFALRVRLRSGMGLQLTQVVQRLDLRSRERLGRPHLGIFAC